MREYIKQMVPTAPLKKKKNTTNTSNTVALKGTPEKIAFYTWLWLSGTRMRNAAAKPSRVDAALYKKFKRASIDIKRRNAFLGSVED